MTSYLKLTRIVTLLIFSDVFPSFSQSFINIEEYCIEPLGLQFIIGIKYEFILGDLNRRPPVTVQIIPPPLSVAANRQFL